MSIKAILYSIFDPLEGPKILHQVPEGSVTQTDAAASSTGNLNSSALVAFSTISRILIPRQSLCGNLISLAPPPLHPTAPRILVLSHPVCLQSTHYRRNEFIFNFALVLSSPDTIDVPSYKSVLTKLAHLMQSLEEQSHFLSDDDSAPGTGKIYNLCEMLMEDLNNYCECMIPIDDFNTLNIKLFPTLPNPVPVRAWHVPLFTVRIETLMDQNWDLTMQRIIPFINGVNSVNRIAGLADADLKLTKKCIRHLLYYGCVLLLDIFSFGAIYAPTADFTPMIASDTEMQAECARYVNSAFEPTRQDAIMLVGAGAEAVSSSMRSSNLGNMSTTGALMDDEIWPRTANDELVDGVGIVQLFANLSQGLTVKEWYAQNHVQLAHIDVRRFITFGIIKGFLYRIHKYAIQTNPRVQDKPESHKTSRKDTKKPSRRNKHPEESEEDDNVDDDDEDARLQKSLTRYLDGTHCFDEICTDLCISEQELVRRLNKPGMGEVVVICR